MKINVDKILWAVFIALLAVLLPHTAWAFQQFERPGMGGLAIAWAGAFAFESMIAVLTWKLARHIEGTPRRLKTRTLPRMSHQYLNAYALGLVLAWAVSTLANLSHAVQYGQGLEIFQTWGIPSWVFAVAFGGILPTVSFTFARVLAKTGNLDEEEDPQVNELKAQIKELKGTLSRTSADLQEADVRARTAEVRFQAAGDLMVKLFSQDKKDRILTIHSTWPELPRASIALMAECSASYVSSILNSPEAEAEMTEVPAEWTEVPAEVS